MRIDIAKENVISRMRWPGSVYHLAIFRVLIGLQILYSSSSKLLDLLQVVDGTDYTKSIFTGTFDGFIEAISVPYLQLTVQILSVFLILGLFTRFILPVLFVAFLLLFSFWYGKFDAPVPWLYLWFPLLIMCFTRCADALSIDKLVGLIKPVENKQSNQYRWPMELFAAWFAYIYFAAGVAKIFPVVKGVNWIAGGTSQEIIYNRFLDSPFYFFFGKPFFDYSSYHWIFSFLSFGSLLLELACVIILLTSRFNVLLFFLILSMHVFLYLTGVPGFTQLAIILGFALFSPGLFHKKDQGFTSENNLHHTPL